MSDTVPAGAPVITNVDLVNAWGRVIVSAFVMAIFLVVAILAFTRAVPATEIVSIIAGAVGTMAAGVVTYWVGSSAGSTAKNSVIASLSAANAPAQPPAKPVPGATP